MIGPGEYHRAAALIRRRGKATGCFEDEQGRICAAYALNLAFLNPSGEIEALQQVAGLLGWADGKSEQRALDAIANWNDRSDTTTEDVAHLLEQAAEKLEAESGVTV
jgi:hypothetical protein